MVLRDIPDETMEAGPGGPVLAFKSPSAFRGGWKFRGGYWGPIFARLVSSARTGDIASVRGCAIGPRC